MHVLANFANSGLDPATADSILLRRIRTLNLSTVSMFLLSAPMATLYWNLGLPTLCAGVVATMIACSANLGLLRSTLNPDLCGHIATALLFMLLLFIAVSSGSFELPYYSWLYIVPLASGTLVNLRACWIWVGVCSATFLCFWTLGELGYEFINIIPEGSRSLLWLNTRITATFSIGILATSFIVAHRQLESALRARSEEQQRESRFVHLLHEAAVAANESSSLFDGLERAVHLVCAAADWPVGRVYIPNPDRKLGLDRTQITHVQPEAPYRDFVSLERNEDRRDVGHGAIDLPERVLKSQRAVWIQDITIAPNYPRAEAARAAGLRTGIGFPVIGGGKVVAVLEFFAEAELERDSRMLKYLEQIGTQLGHLYERERTEKQIHDLAFYDTLTGLPNRQLFHERLQIALGMAERKGRKIALFFLDLDGFKTVNDTLGHDVGDQLLAAVATRLSNSVRSTDCVAWNPALTKHATVSRLGGDEFTVLLSEVDGAAGVASVAQRILDALRAPIRIGDHDVVTSASIGIALYPQDATNPELLRICADSAMYRSKSLGRGCYQFFTSELAEQNQRRLDLVTGLTRAIAGNRFSVLYQPLRDTQTSRVVGTEALLRWNDPSLGSISPEEFIPVAEQCGLIGVIGAWVLREATAQCQAWIEDGYDPIRVCVNVSGHQIRDPNFAEFVESVLAECGLSADLLELEITESTIVEDDAKTIETLHSLCDLGIGLALDDFGTGFSCLSNLRHFPIDRLKIDQSFVNELPENQDASAIVAAIIAMAHSLRLKVVAEGVETEAQLDFLRSLECDEVQGFLFSGPISSSAVGLILDRTKDSGST